MADDITYTSTSPAGPPDSTKQATVIEAVAQRQVEDLQTDEHKQFEELERELHAQGIEWEAKYLELLNIRREQLLNAEIKERLQVIQNNNAILLMISTL